MVELAPEKIVVQSFYQEVGWQQEGSSDRFMDAVLFEDLRPVTGNYRARANQRVLEALDRNGDMLLDVASGPIQYDDYLQFSRGYKRRVCVDLSMRALEGARRRIGDAGLYVLADITALPFRSESFDGIVSLHTIYHVPAAEQSNAVKELERTLRPSRQAVVVYKWNPSLLKILLASPFKFLDGVKKVILQVPGAKAIVHRSRARPANSDGWGGQESEGGQELPPLYFHAHGLRWFRQQVAAPFSMEVRCWRSLEVPSLKQVPDSAGGRRILGIVQALEDRFPHLFGLVGSYPLIVITRRAQEARQTAGRPPDGR